MTLLTLQESEQNLDFLFLRKTDTGSGSRLCVCVPVQACLSLRYTQLCHLTVKTIGSLDKCPGVGGAPTERGA